MGKMVRFMLCMGFPGGSEVKESACSAEDLGSIPVLGASPGEGNGNPLQYSCLENPMDGGAWWATVHGDTKSQTRLSEFTFFHFCVIYALPQFEKIKTINTKKKGKKIHVEALSSKETHSASGELDMTSGSVPRGPDPLWAQNLLRTRGDGGGRLLAAGL